MPSTSEKPQWGLRRTSSFDDALAYADDQVFVFDDDGRFVDANSAGLAFLGVPSEELIGARWADLGAAEETREPFHSGVYGVYSLKRPLRGVIEVPAAEATKYFEYSLSPIMGDRGEVKSVILVSRDITERRLAEETLRATEYFNASLLRLYGALGRSTTYTDITEALRPEMLEVLGFRGVHVLLRGDRDSFLLLDTGTASKEAIGHVMKIDTRDRTKVGDEDFLVLRTAKDPLPEEPARAEDVYVVEDAKANPFARRGAGAGLGQHTVVMVPLALAEGSLGFLALTTVGEEVVRMPDTRQIDYLRALANHVAVAIDRVRFMTERREAHRTLQSMYGQLGNVLQEVVGALASTTRLRDPYTTAHQEAVARLSCSIATEMGLDGEVIDGLRMAALLHDIGKITVPAEILVKPSKLSDMEMGIVRAHPALASDLLGDVEFNRPVATIVRQHHERLDGSGYPDGIKGDEMLLESKILAVADVVEAMSSDRPYRPALGIEAGLAEVEQHSGTRYDADAVAACARLVRATGRLP